MDDRTGVFVYVGFWKRVLAALIDAAIGWVVFPVTLPTMQLSLERRTVLPMLIWSLLWTVLWLYLVVHFGGTPGKLVIGARIVDAQGRFLSWGKAVLRVLLSLIISFNHLLQMHAVVTGYPDSAPHLSLLEIGKLLHEYGQPYTSIGTILALLIYVDIGVILTNPRKRALHDYIAGSYVITRESHACAVEENIEPYPPADDASTR
jgi:uncharacterized RDD family membrane protein YckC